ncbi:MAG: hypothetical protein FWE03_06865 [Firmicutes bacterium]|nr:hypothetical protein [Bacillota bacterium]
MKKKNFLIIVVVVLIMFAFMGCSAPNLITNESFNAVAYSEKLEIRIEENTLIVDLSDTAMVSFTQFNSNADAIARFRFHETHINNYNIHTNSFQANMLNHDIWRVNAGGSFYAIYRIESGVLFARGLTSERDMIRNFINLLTQ